MVRRVVKLLIPRRLFKALEPYGHLAEAVCFNAINLFPARGLKVIGVTGTNGKTTTAFMIHRLLHEAGIPVGLMTTVAYGAGMNIKPQVQHMTTVSVPQLMRRIKALRREGIEWLVLETTSHALAQNRVWGIPYSVAVMTNVTHEHLDYHGSFQAYLAAKLKLFRLAAKNRRGLQLGVINAEDPHAAAFAALVPKPLRYGIDNGELKATKLQAAAGSSRYTAQYGERKIEIEVNLPGRFNVFNSLAAVGVGLALRLSDQEISRGIAALTSVEGRMDTIDTGQDFTVINDFAHTPDSFAQLLPEVKKITKGRLIALFGSAGRRDEGKRPIQGRLAGEHADLVVITEEDDRDIDGQQIMAEIAGGAEAAGKRRDQDLFMIHDRTEAINFAIGRAKKGDTVLLLGKGHEKTIERADGEHPWDEAAVARAAIEIRGK